MIDTAAEIAFRTVGLSEPQYEREGLRFATVQSPALNRRGDVSVWIPEVDEIGTLLILMHGLYSSHWAWPMRAGVHRTAHTLTAEGIITPMVIAMPSDGLALDGSGYLPLATEDVERWIVEEVPAIARLAAPALRADARIAIAGLSMGGYGALRLGAKYPDRFCAISAHSAITGIADFGFFIEGPLDVYLNVAPSEELDPLYWLRLHRDRLPRLRFDCGLADHLLPGNRALHEALLKDGIAHQFQEFAGGHDWSYWRENVTHTLRFVSEEIEDV